MDRDREILDIVALITGEMSEEEFDETCPTKYKLTANDIKEIQDNADRELFGSGSSYL